MSGAAAGLRDFSQSSLLAAPAHQRVRTPVTLIDERRPRSVSPALGRSSRVSSSFGAAVLHSCKACRCSTWNGGSAAVAASAVRSPPEQIRWHGAFAAVRRARLGRLYPGAEPLVRGADVGSPGAGSQPAVRTGLRAGLVLGIQQRRSRPAGMASGCGGAPQATRVPRGTADRQWCMRAGIRARGTRIVALPGGRTRVGGSTAREAA